jgi:peptide/nickel transport system permease protein
MSGSAAFEAVGQPETPAAGAGLEASFAGSPAGPWRRALWRLSRDRTSLGAGVVLLVILVACLAAPLYASLVSGTDPFRSNLSGKIVVDGKRVAVMQPSTEGRRLGVTPIGPTWRGPYLLGADAQGRDVVARLLYGGRNSLMIAGFATALSLLLAAAIGVTAGFLSGGVDILLSRILDVLWAFPVYLLAISLSIVLITKPLIIGSITLGSGSLMLPIVIIGLVYVPYVARPVRGQVLALRASEFVLASVGLGMPTWRILMRDILPNVSTTLIVYIPLMMALNITTESALSFLSVGVQSPDASWGTIIQDGQELLYTRPAVSLAPGLAIVITVLALNLLGDSVRDALDPRAGLRR